MVQVLALRMYASRCRRSQISSRYFREVTAAGGSDVRACAVQVFARFVNRWNSPPLLPTPISLLGRYILSAMFGWPTVHPTLCLHSDSGQMYTERHSPLRWRPQAFRMRRHSKRLGVAGGLDANTRPAEPPLRHRALSTESVLPWLVTRFAAIPYCTPAEPVHRTGWSSLSGRTVPQHAVDLPSTTAIERGFGRALRLSLLPSSLSISVRRPSPGPGRARDVHLSTSTRCSPRIMDLSPEVRRRSTPGRAGSR